MKKSIDKYKCEIARQETIAYYESRKGINPGANGCIFEVSCQRPLSRKSKVASQNRPDVHIKVNGRYVVAECKTNGGRVESLYSNNAPKFVIYQLDTNIKHKAGKTTPERIERRFVSAVVIKTDLFLAKLEEFGALKSTNGKNPELAIQVSNKRWYEWLLQYPIPFDRNGAYTSDDFDELI